MGAFKAMKLPGGTDAEIRIRFARLIVVHVQSRRVEFAYVDEIAVGRLPYLLLSLYYTEDLQGISSVFSSVVFCG